MSKPPNVTLALSGRLGLTGGPMPVLSNQMLAEAAVAHAMW